MKLTAAVIGLGRIGSGYDRGNPGKVPRSHVGAILSDPRYRLVAACDSNRASIEGFRRDWGDVAPTYSSLGEFLSRGAPDVAVVATPAETHRAILEEVLAAKPRLVFCEKPCCESAGDASAVRASASRHGVPVLVNFHRRWDRRFRRLATRFRKLGRPEFVHVTYRKGLTNYGSHAVDLLQRFFGEVVHVRAERQVSDLADPSCSGTLTFSSGLRATLSGVDGAEYELLDIEIFFKTVKFTLRMGGYSVEILRPRVGTHYPGYLSLPRTGESLAEGPVSGLAEAYREIPRVLAGTSRLNYATPETAVEVHRVLAAVRRSARTGRGVRP